MQLSKSVLIGIVVLVSIQCTQKPKVIEAQGSSNGTTSSSGIFSKPPAADQAATTMPVNGESLHTVVALEVLPTEKYVYVRVKEGEDEFWIAATKQDIQVGKTYFYKKSLLQEHFESKEYNRVFDKLYLVSNLVSGDHGMEHNMALPEETVSSEVKNSSPVKVEGSMSISDLLKQKTSLAGKRVTVSGRVTKVNNNILGKNWIHIKDGSKDDFDLVVTSPMTAQIGQVITVQATLTLNKDFGSGYSYELILEEGVFALQ